jgi:hypothetical protein
LLLNFGNASTATGVGSIASLYASASRAGNRRVNARAVLPFTALPLERIREPFDDPRYVYELKYDGFRALAFVRRGGVTLVSRTGRHFGRRFAALEASTARWPARRDAVLTASSSASTTPAAVPGSDVRPRDAGIRCVRPARRERSRHSRTVAIASKRLLRRIVPNVNECGFTQTTSWAPVVISLRSRATRTSKESSRKKKLLAGRSSWAKIKHREYSQARDRHELFDRTR